MLLWCLGLRSFEVVVRVLNFEDFGLLEAAEIVICSIGSLSRIPNATICHFRGLSRLERELLRRQLSIAKKTKLNPKRCQVSPVVIAV